MAKLSTVAPGLSLDRLRALGLGEQAFKAALAAGLAWSVGGLVPGAPPQPYLAPLTAVLTVQLTVAESVTGAIQRTIGATTGVVVALAAGNAIGVNPITVALLVLVAQAIAGVLRLNVIGTSQVIVTALLVLTIGSTTTLAFGWARVAETIVGAIIGVAINALLVPPSYLPAAAAATESLVEALTEELELLATALETGLSVEVAMERLEDARRVTRQFQDTLSVLQRAEQSLRFNMRAARDIDQLDEYQRQMLSLEHTAIQVRSLTRTLSDAVADPRAEWIRPELLGGALAQLVREAGQVLSAFASGDDPAAAQAEFVGSREQLTRADPNLASLLSRGYDKAGAVLATLDRMIDDLSHGPVALEQLEDEV